MLKTIVLAVVYELQAPGTPFAPPAVLIDNPIIPPGTTTQDKRQIHADHRTDQEESAVLMSLENFNKASAIRAIPEAISWDCVTETCVLPT